MKYCILVATLFFTIPVFSQRDPVVVEGNIVEESTLTPIGFVQVGLILLPDSLLTQVSTSDASGHFSFEDYPAGRYFIEAHLSGYNIQRSAAFDLSPHSPYDAGTISMQPSITTLDAIQITANRSPFVNGIDRKIYYPQADIQSQAGSVSDILQNIPSVTIEPEGEILLRGSANIQFLVNGLPSALLKNNSATVLELMPAHTIERIEIITNPSARFKPDGDAGIINIITRKNVLTGFHGSILANASTSQRFNGNISLSYNPGKVQLTGLYSYWQNYSPRTYSDHRILQDSLIQRDVIFDLRSNSVSRPYSHTASFSLNYQPLAQTSLGISASYFTLNALRSAEINTLETIELQTRSDYTTTKTDDDTESEFEISTYAEHAFKKEDHTIILEAQYDNYDELEDSGFSDMYRVPAYLVYRGHNLLHKKGHTTSLSLDYANPINEDLEFEAGYEGEYASGDLDFYTEFFDFQESLWKTDVAKTNRFLYQQDIHALYVTLSKSLDGFGIAGGVRAEQTNILSNLVQFDSIIPNRYFNLFPTLHLSYEISDQQKIGLSYSRRVNRPDSDELNPFPEYIDIRDIEAGNPHLRPEQIHSVELTFHHQRNQFSFLPTVYYRQTYDGFAEETQYLNDSVLLTTLVNLEKENAAGLELVLSWSPTKRWNFNLNSNLFYHTIDASNLGYEDDKSIISSDFKLSGLFNILSTTKLQFNATYRSASLTAQGRSLPVYFLNAGLRHDLFKRKASITLAVSDVFNTMRFKYEINTPSLQQVVIRKRKSQIWYLGFAYRFGISGKTENEELLFDNKL